MENALQRQTTKRKRGFLRACLWSLFAIVFLVFGAAIVSGSLVYSLGPQGAVLHIRQWLNMIRPFILLIQCACVAAVWWYWEPLIRRSRLAPNVQSAWLAARHRMALWASALVMLGVFLWSSVH